MKDLIKTIRTKLNLNQEQLQKLDLMILKDRSIVRRKEGIALADRIVTEHRRDGRYFDEILRGVES